MLPQTFEENIGDNNQQITITICDKDFNKQVSLGIDTNATERMVLETKENAAAAMVKEGVKKEDLRVIIWDQKRILHFNKFKSL